MTLSGQTIGPYRVQREIGRGGMATVYLCTHLGEQRAVALKVLLPHLASDPMIVRRFKLEGENGARLRHPNIVAVQDAGYADGHHYLAMEYIGGGTLADLLKRRKQPMSVEEALPILRQVADALDFAHGLGILHRDVKPSNFLLDPNNRVLLTDFGVARHLAADHTVVTVAGFAVGTPAYMSPEQARGDMELDRRSDVYSLGVVAYAVLTGQLPFDAPSQLVLLRKIIDDAPVMPEVYQPSLPGGVGFALRKVLAKDPARRYATAGEFVAALDQGRRWKPTPLDLAAAEKALLEQPPSQAHAGRNGTGSGAGVQRRSRGGSSRWWLATAVLLLVVGAGAWYFYTLPGIARLLPAAALSPATSEAGNTEDDAGTGLAANPVAANLSGGNGVADDPTNTPTATASVPIATPTPEVVSILLTPYQDEERGFVLNVPQGWQPVAEAGGLRFAAPDLPAALFVYAMAEDAGGDTSAAAVQSGLEKYVGALPEQFPNAAGLQRQEIRGSGPYPAITFETHREDGPINVVQMVQVGKPGRKFVLGQQIARDEVARYGMLLPAVVGSFAVLPEPTPTSTATVSATATENPTETPTETAVPPTNTPTVAPTMTPIPSATPSPTASATATGTATWTPTATATLTPSATSTRAATATLRPSATPTVDAAATSTREAQHIATLVAATLAAMPTSTPAAPPIPSATPTPNATPTPDLNVTLTAIAVQLTQLAPTATPDLNMTLTAIAIELTRLAETPMPPK